MPSSELSVVFSYKYVLYPAKTKEFYMGHARDLEHRVAEHNKGLNFSTIFAKTTLRAKLLNLPNLSQQKVYY